MGKNVKYIAGSKARTLLSTTSTTSRLRSRPPIDKLVLLKPSLPLPSSRIVCATSRRRLPPRPRPTAASFFDIVESLDRLSVDGIDHTTQDKGSSSVARSPRSTLQDDIRSSKILSTLAEVSNGRSLDASYFGVTCSTPRSSQGLSDHDSHGRPSSAITVPQVVAPSQDRADDLPDFDEDASESEDATGLTRGTCKKVSEPEAVSFLESLFGPEEAETELPPSPSPQPTVPATESFNELQLLAHIVADDQDCAFGILTPLSTYSYMDMAWGDEAVLPGPSVVSPTHVVPPLPCTPSDKDMAMDVEFAPPAVVVVSSISASPSLDYDMHECMEGVEVVCHASLNAVPVTTLWTMRETVQISENDGKLFGNSHSRFDFMEDCEEDDMAMTVEDLDMQLLTHCFASSLKLDDEGSHSIQRDLVHDVTSDHVYVAPSLTPLIARWSCLQLGLQPKLLFTPYLHASHRTVSHPPWPSLMEVD